MDDEGRPLAAALQGEAANHRKVRRLRAVRAERCGEGEPSARQVGARKASESDPLMKCRKHRPVTSKPGVHLSPGMSLAGTCLLARRCPARRWREPGSGVHSELGNLSLRNRGRFGDEDAPGRERETPKRLNREGLSTGGGAQGRTGA